MANETGFLPPNLQFVDPATGIINQQWMYFLLSLFNRTGGSNGIITNSVASISGSSSFDVPIQNSFYLIDASSNSITVNLPTSASAKGITLAFKRTDDSSNMVKIWENNGLGSGLDDLQSYFLTHQYDWVEIFSNGTGWFIISANNFFTPVGIGQTPSFELDVLSNGGNTADHGQIARFWSGNSPVSANLYDIGITKNGVESVYLGINKNTVTGDIPANGAFLSTNDSSGTLSIGRGNGSGSPDNSDIFIDGTGKIGIGNQTAPAEALDVLGNVQILGTHSNTFKWESNIASPASAPFLLPATQPVVGGTSEFLGTPTKWALINIAGTEYKIPAY